MVDVTSQQKFFFDRRPQTRGRGAAEAAQLLDLVAQAGRRLDEALNEHLDAAGLTPAQGRVLRAVAAEPGLSVGQLTARLGISKQSLAPVLKVLLGRGVVMAAETHADRRRRLLRLSAEGEAIWANISRDAAALLADAANNADPGAASGFHAVLQQLAQSTDDAP